jgi:hypothetical protein
MEKWHKKWGILGLTALLLVFSLGGCLESWGRLKMNPAMNDGWKNRGLNPDYTYYYCGRSGLPDAVVGIDKAWTFDSRFWFRIESMDEVYDKIDHLSNLERDQNIRYAKDILAPDGRLVGTYFSYYLTTPVFVDAGTGRVVVYDPYKQEDDK